jgi:type VI protein secretion system component VasK
VSLAGASAFGAQDAGGIRRLEAVCELIRAEKPDCPIVRGVVVLFPISWAGLPESIKWASALRDDLRAIERHFKVRCPVFTLFPEMESTPGFSEFTGRMTSALKQGRCGFAVPSSQAFSGDLVQRGLIWMSGWFHGWILNLMAEDLLNQAGNNRLFLLDHEFRRYRKRLRAVMEAAFSTHSGTEPILFRGCYFLATGKAAREQAFVAGLLRGPRGRIFADHAVTQWTGQAEDDDRFYRRLALGVGLVSGGLTMASWLGIIFATGNPWWWIGPVVLALVWTVAAIRIGRW